MVLSRPDAVAGWRAMMGPTDPEKAKQEQPDRFDHWVLITSWGVVNSLRALFGADLTKNAVHGSSDQEKAKDVIQMIFGEDVKLDAQLSKTPAGWFIPHQWYVELSSVS